MNTMAITELFREAERLEQAGDAQGACDLYKTWVALNPSDPNLHAACFNHAVVMARAGDRSGAMTALRHALLLKPDFQPPRINLGRLLEDSGQSGSAVSQWMELVNATPQMQGDALRHKLMALQQIGRVLENNHVDAPAEDALRRSIDLRPDQPEVVQHWIALRQRQCKWPVVEAWDGVSKPALFAHISPLSAAVMLDDPMFQLARAAHYAKSSIGIPDLVPPDHTARQRPRPEKLRIGYVSSDLREHAVGFGLSEVMELHDRVRFEVHAYYCGIEREDSTKARIRSSVDHWTDITRMSDDAVAAKIVADGIDILIDVNGYTRDARTAVFARKPAPVQVNWYGFPGSMGTPYHHYVVGDEHVIPAAHEKYFSERVVRLPCYQPNDRQRKVAAAEPQRAAEGLPPEGFVFCCLNGSQKITPEIFAAWMKILHGVPGSVLWLLDSGAELQARLRHEAERQGIPAQRLCFAPKRPNPEHLARYKLADLFLDTFPYGAHTTASDAMWMGVPVLTLMGRSFASRVCGGLVLSAGLPELVCETVNDYVTRAISVATAAGFVTELRDRLRANRDSAAMFDTPRLVFCLELLYDGMWSDFSSGRLPQPDLRNLDAYLDVGVALHGTSPDHAIEDAAYLEKFRRRHAIYPIGADNRLWTLMAQQPVQMPPRQRPVPMHDRDSTPAWLQRAG